MASQLGQGPISPGSAH